MSRSYKHNPYYTEKFGKITKKQANKKVRQMLKNIDYEVGNNRGYKSLVESWDIHDLKIYQSEQQAIADWKHCFALGYTTRTEEDTRQNWAKWNRRK